MYHALSYLKVIVLPMAYSIWLCLPPSPHLTSLASSTTSLHIHSVPATLAFLLFWDQALVSHQVLCTCCSHAQNIFPLVSACFFTLVIFHQISCSETFPGLSKLQCLSSLMFRIPSLLTYVLFTTHMTYNNVFPPRVVSTHRRQQM